MLNFSGLDEQGKPLIILAITRKEIEAAVLKHQFHICSIEFNELGRQFWVVLAPWPVQDSEKDLIQIKAKQALKRSFKISTGETILLTKEQIIKILEWEIFFLESQVYPDVGFYILRGSTADKITSRLVERGIITSETRLSELSRLNQFPPSLN